MAKEKERGKLSNEDTCFPNFLYVHPELQKIESEAEKADERRVDFTKKSTPSTL